jgi:hypothetical protein
MKRSIALVLVLGGLIAAGIGVLSATAGNSSSTEAARPMQSRAVQASPAADLRVALDRLLGEHAVLAMNATNQGVTGSKSFPAAGKSLDRNSVELSKAIASIYGKNAGGVFLNGKFQWRDHIKFFVDHIKFFVDYTVALAKKDKAGQAKAVANLTRYTKEHGAFLAKATGLPKLAVQNDLLGHVLELKNQLDSYASGDYTKATGFYRQAYSHMFKTGDLLSGAIAKQKNLR